MALTFATRAEWTKCQLPKPSIAIADYASAEEISQLKAAMITRFKQLGNEPNGSAEDLRSKRLCIRQALRRIERGKLPLFSEPTTEDLLAGLKAKYEEARTETHNEIAADEEAWSRELQRRDELNRCYGSAK